MKSYSLNLSLVLLYLVPVSLLTGSFLPDLIISLISLIFLFLTISEKKFKYFKNKYFVLFISFYIYILISSFFTSEPLFSLKTTLPYIRFIIFPLAVWYLLEQRENALKYFTYFFIFTFLLALLDGVYQIVYGFNLIGLRAELFWNNRLILTFHDTMILGGYLARLSPLLLGLLFIFFSKNKYFYLLSCIFIIILDIVVYYSGERTAIGLIFLSSLFIIIFASKLRGLRIISLALIFIILAAITVSNDKVRERNINMTMKQVGLSLDSSEIVYFSKYHHSHIASSLKMFASNPLFGVGPNMFRKLCDNDKYKYDEYSCSTHPHNIYAQILAENGMIGFIFLLIIIYFAIREMIKHSTFNKKNKDSVLSTAEVCIVSCIFLSLWPFLPSNNLFNNWISVIYYLPIGFYLFLNDKKTNF